MNYKIFTSANFRREAKPITKKFPSLIGELAELERQLLTNPLLGKSLGRNCYKIRLAVKSKGKGKSGGLRVITMLVYHHHQPETFQEIEHVDCDVQRGIWNCLII